MRKIHPFPLLALFLCLPAQAELLAIQAKDDCARIQGNNLNDPRRINGRAKRSITFFELCTGRHTGELTEKLGPHVLFKSTLLCCQGLSVGVTREILVNKCGPLGWPSVERGREGGLLNALPKLPTVVFKCEEDAAKECSSSRGSSQNCLPKGKLN